MNRLKSIFISAFNALLFGTSAYLLWRLYQSAEPWNALAGLMVVLPPTLFFVQLFTVPPARTGRWLVGFGVPMLIGGVWILARLFTGVDMEPAEWILPGVVFFGWLLYLAWYSGYGVRDRSKVQKGSALPEFTVWDADGGEVSSTRYLGAPAVFLFIRGNWCPFCMAQVKELAALYRRITEMSAKIVIIAGQSQSHTRKLSARFDVPMDFLYDPDLNTARQLGLFHESGTPVGIQALGYSSDTIMPSVLITDASGIVRYADLPDNYRLRPEPEQFLWILDEMASKKA
jgi:peroxiredoxin